MQRSIVVFVVHIWCLKWLVRPVGSFSKDTVEMRMGNVLSPRSAEGDSTVSKNYTEEEISTQQVAWKNEDGCGIVTTTSGGTFPRIVGGQDAKKGDWPWMAMILRYYDRYSKFSFVCGGSLIKKQWVLTAGHCFFGGPASYTQVVLGAHKKDMSDSTVERFAVARYRCHRYFVGSINAFKDDACLIKLAGEVKYSDFIKPICLPSNGQRLSVSEVCEIAGWGETQGNGNNKVLQQAHIKILNKGKCDSWYMEYDVTLPTDHFCAGYEKGGTDSCQGDSGGPLTCSRTERKITSNVLFGITSFGIGCAQEKLPGVYTDVTRYTDWVATRIAQLSEPESCFNQSHLIACAAKVTKSGTTIRTPVVSERTWLYPSNSRCPWNIEAPAGCSILLKFRCFFHVEINPNNSTECYDYVKIESKDADILSVYCGSKLLNPVKIRSNKATVYFHSDSSVESSGFVMEVHFLAPKSIIPRTQKNVTSTSTSTNRTRNGTTSSTNDTTVIDTGHLVTNEGGNKVQVTSHKECKINCNSARRLTYSSLFWVVIFEFFLLRSRYSA